MPGSSFDPRAMASTRESSNNKGAAEEPEPPPSPSLSSAASYDPREYQPPHPDDRDNDGLPSKVTKGKDTTEGGTKDKQGAAKGKGAKDPTRCSNCDAKGAVRKCKRCGVEAYCSEECQRVSVVVVWGRAKRVRSASQLRVHVTMYILGSMSGSM